MDSKLTRFVDSFLGTPKTFWQSLNESPLVLIHISPKDLSADQLTLNKIGRPKNRDVGPPFPSLK